MAKAATRIYLDVSCLKRSFDDQSQPRVAEEAVAVDWLLERIALRALEFVSSEVMELENARNPRLDRRLRAEDLLDEAGLRVEVSESVARRAAQLERSGVPAIDALHVACAESAACAYLATCDDRLIRRAARCGKLSCEVLNPTELVRKLGP